MVHNSQRTFLLLTFLFLTFYLSPVFALPLQGPIVGVYQCYSSPTDPFDMNAQSINATLEFFADQTYRFTTASATEAGIIATNIYQGEADSIEILFQSGSALALQPTTSSNIYKGNFFMDYLGEGYVTIGNNNGVIIRCESEGASLEAAMQTAKNRTEYEQPAPLPVLEGFETLEYLGTFQPGVYGCVYTVDSVNGLAGNFPSYYPDDDPSVSSVIMFADGNTLTLEQSDIYKSDYSTGTYSFDTARGRVNAQGGTLGGLSLLYGTNALGKTVLYSRQTTYSTDKEGSWLDIQYIATHFCEYQQDVPAELSAGYPDSTPKIDLNNISVTAGKYDATINLELEPITDTYYCYPSYGALEAGDGYARYLREYILEILPSHRYTFNGQAGEFRTGTKESYLQWLSGPLNPTSDIVEDENDYGLPHSATVAFSDWGSEINYIEVPDAERSIKIDCFQQGAREQKALLDFALKQPTLTTYACLPSGDNPQRVGLELLPNNRYRFNNQEGSYQTHTDSYSTDIFWESGPLHDDTEYVGDDATGLRTLKFTFTEVHGIIPVGVSTDTTMVCQGVAKANLIPKYSATLAPPLPAGSGGLNGFYARGEYDTDADGSASSSAEWSYHHFLPDGSVYQDGYIISDECSKTYPNGKSVCKGYSLQGNVLNFSDGDSISFSQADNGGIILDGVLYDNKGLSGPQTLSGKYEFLQTTSSPVFSTVSGSFSSLSSSYNFIANSYEYSSIGESTFFAGGGFDVPGVFGQDSSSESDSGSYTISGNVITFNSVQGYAKQCTFFFPVTGDTTRINICGTDYGPVSQE
jgi:hypothetical protein